jgi:hypothetical protein
LREEVAPVRRVSHSFFVHYHILNRYYHEKFLRSRPDLAVDMARTRVKGNGMKPASSPDTEPNFYVMEPCSEKKWADHPPKPLPQVIPSSPVGGSSSSNSSSSSSQFEVDDQEEEEESAPFVAYGSTMPSLSLMETDPPVPSFSLSKALSLSRNSSFLVEPSAVISLPSTPVSTDMKTASFDPHEDWPGALFFTHVSSVADLFHQWTGERAIIGDGEAFAMDCDLDGESVGLEMNL